MSAPSPANPSPPGPDRREIIRASQFAGQGYAARRGSLHGQRRRYPWRVWHGRGPDRAERGHGGPHPWAGWLRPVCDRHDAVEGRGNPGCVRSADRRPALRPFPSRPVGAAPGSRHHRGIHDAAAAARRLLRRIPLARRRRHRAGHLQCSRGGGFHLDSRPSHSGSGARRTAGQYGPSPRPPDRLRPDPQRDPARMLRAHAVLPAPDRPCRNWRSRSLLVRHDGRSLVGRARRHPSDAQATRPDPAEAPGAAALRLCGSDRRQFRCRNRDRLDGSHVPRPLRRSGAGRDVPRLHAGRHRLRPDLERVLRCHCPPSTRRWWPNMLGRACNRSMAPRSG